MTGLERAVGTAAINAAADRGISEDEASFIADAVVDALRRGTPGRYTPEPSMCEHCGRPIVWEYDNAPDDEVPADERDVGWWLDRWDGTELCGGTEDGYHRPLGATEDNGWPDWR